MPNNHPCCSGTADYCSQNYVDNPPSNFTCAFESIEEPYNPFLPREVEAYSPTISLRHRGLPSPGPTYSTSAQYDLDHNMFDTRFTHSDGGGMVWDNTSSYIFRQYISKSLQAVINHSITSSYNAKDLFIVLSQPILFRQAMSDQLTLQLRRIDEDNVSSGDLAKRIERALLLMFIRGTYSGDMVSTLSKIESSRSGYATPVGNSHVIAALSVANDHRVSLYPKASNYDKAQRERQLVNIIPSDINLKLKVYTKDGCTARVKVWDNGVIPVYRDQTQLSVNTDNEFLKILPYYSDRRGNYMGFGGCHFHGCSVAMCSDREYAYGLNSESRSLILKTMGDTIKGPRIDLMVENDHSIGGFGLSPEMTYSLAEPLKEWYFLASDWCGESSLSATLLDNDNVKKTIVKYSLSATPDSMGNINSTIKKGGYGNIMYINVDDPFWGTFNSTSSLSATIYDINLDGAQAKEKGIYPRRIPKHLLLVPCNTTDTDPLQGRSEIEFLAGNTIVRRTLSLMPNPITSVLSDTYIKTTRESGGFNQGTDLHPILKQFSIPTGYFTNKAFTGGVQPTKKEHIIRKAYRILSLIGANYNLNVYPMNGDITKADLWKLMNYREFIDFMIEVGPNYPLPNTLDMVDVLNSATFTSHLLYQSSLGNTALVEAFRVMDSIPRV